MVLASVLCGVVLIWVFLYLLAYVVFLSPDYPDTKTDTSTVSTNFANSGANIDSTTSKLLTQLEQHLQQEQRSVTTIAQKYTNFFLSQSCKTGIDEITTEIDRKYAKAVTVIIAARNERRAALVATVSSVLANSGSLLASIVIVDDFSYDPISEWPEWKQHFPDMSKIQIVRLPAHCGVACAKNKGARLVADTHHTKRSDELVVVFLDSHSVVSSQWLVPLANTLEKAPDAVAYPIVDVMLPEEDYANSKLIKADNTVGAFDWALQFRWEPLASSSNRLPAHFTSSDSAEVFSPAAPGIFAVRLQYFLDLGMFDEQLSSNSVYGQENIELSIRVWLCGGVVIRQECSRVAHRMDNLEKYVPAGEGVTEEMVDSSVFTIANKWLNSATRVGTIEFKELVYQARFSTHERTPYMVDYAIDPSQTHAKSVLLRKANDGTSLGSDCTNFEWYLSSVYPGLLEEISTVEKRFKAVLRDGKRQQNNFLLDSSGKIPDSIQLLLHQYSKPSDHITIIQEEVQLLKDRENLLRASAASRKAAMKHVFQEPPIVQKKKPLPQDLKMDRYDLHMEKVRTQLVCEDISLPAADSADSCASKLAHDPDMCVTQKSILLFICPHTCGFCDAGTGKFCEDFYLNKCKKWSSDGMCGQPEIADKCMKSCGGCTPSYNVIKGDGIKKTSSEIISNPVDAHKSAQLNDRAVAVEFKRVNPGLPHTQFLEGKLPDDYDPQIICSIFNDKPNGQLLARVNVASPAVEGVRIFCGIYTMEKNHRTNVLATRNTWAKHCDGFIAFSTAEDLAIPSINISHEGDESYDNMWQKSRSIWKYIYSHLSGHYDYYLLGGDDMFYIINNLRFYLNSAEMVEAQRTHEGLYVGRIFQPPKQEIFNSGGAGYLVDSKALKILGENLDSPKCFPHQRGFWEDVNVANCLKKSGGIVPYDTRDGQKRERFHPFTPGQHLTYRIPPKNPDWYAKYNPELKIGFDCCSDESLSFHYVGEQLMYQLHNYVHHCTDKH